MLQSVKRRLIAVKDKLYDYFAVKNWGVDREYGLYKLNHMEEHKKRPWKDWWRLIRLNWHYRVLRRTDYLYGRDGIRETKPYLEGRESDLTHLPAPIHFVKALMKYDIISFDVFDTLIFRPLAKPTDAFMLLGQKLAFIRFARIRKEAEQKAREKKQQEKETREVTLEEIYDQIEWITGLNAKKAAKVELDMEKSICYANPYMKQVFDLLIVNGKKVVLTSDMYLRESQIAEILHNCGYQGYDKLFVSCEYGVSKGVNGDLYKIVKQKYGPDKTYCHVGDNENSDVIKAEENGFKAFYYPNVNKKGNPYRATYAGMSELIGSAYGGIVNAKLHNGLNGFSPVYEYGYTYGGLYVLGYCSWIYKQAKINNFDKIIFLARDGDIYLKVFRQFFSDISADYLLWSRLPNTRILANVNRYEYTERYLNHRLLDSKPMSIRSVLHVMRLDDLTSKLDKYGLAIDMKVSKDNIGQLYNMIIDLWNEILIKYKAEEAAAKQYICKIINTSKKIAIVDVGWAGTSPLSIKRLIENEWKLDCEVHCLLAGSYSYPIESILPQNVDGSLESYMFDQTKNRALKDYHVNHNNAVNTMIFELFTQAQIPTMDALGIYCEELKLDFGFPEVENYKITSEMQKGIMDFANDYEKRFIEYPWLNNISGHDAYIPFMHITKDLTLIKNLFSDIEFANFIGHDEETMHLETVGEFIKRRIG